MALIARLGRNLTFRVLVAIALGVLLGVLAPGTAKAMKPLGDTFVNLVRMVIAPIIFLTIVLGVAHTTDLKKVGRVGLKAFVYFEVVSTAALAIGLVLMNFVRPGEGIDASRIARGDVSAFTAQGKEMHFVDFLTHVVPSSAVGAFAQGEILQVVFFSILFGVALASLGRAGRPVTRMLDRLGQVFFRVVGIVMVVAPIGAFGAMAYTIGNFGVQSLLTLGRLMACVYGTMAVFIFGVLNLIARWSGFSLLGLLRYIKDEILIVLGTSSSEAVLPRMIDKMERYGCDRRVVGLVIPAGYSFNLDGTSIYLSMATLFIAQAYGVPLTLGQQLGVRDSDGDVEGRRRGDRLRLHRAGEHARGTPRGSRRGGGAGAGGGPVHERGALDHQSDRQRGGDGGDLEERGRVRRHRRAAQPG
jgi:aerobic C4-dicarboxylate transport protein